ncbi:unnamed protein product [Clonostachys chloroleuca]|uniref:Uncharacterized protein n=1 Tax=Clonostachys chloroleuca TaxID=1926264 RepID=A0AA35QCI9_9HYPO|nr:unnamed protein product [Clonostachys chloroleuca]
MASDILPDEAKKQIYQDGFFMLGDPKVGSSIEEMKAKQKSFDFSGEAGFEFCRDRVLLNSSVQSIISALESDTNLRYVLAYRGSLPPDAGHICTLRNGGEDLGILIVQVWPKGSSAIFYSGSHMVPLQRARAANRIWEVAPKQLKDSGCKAENFQDSFRDTGGIVVFDARISFERQKERSYFYTYVATPLLERWRKAGQTNTWGLRPPPSQDPQYVETLGVYMRQEDLQQE